MSSVMGPVKQISNQKHNVKEVNVDRIELCLTRRLTRLNPDSKEKESQLARGLSSLFPHPNSPSPQSTVGHEGGMVGLHYYETICSKHRFSQSCSGKANSKNQFKPLLAL